MAKVINAGSDIQLLFGVLGGGELSGESGTLIKKQLTELQKALNADPLKIKVALDTEAGGKKSWSSMLQTKLNALSDSEKFSIKISRLDIGNGAIGDFKRRIEAVLNTLSLEKGVSLSVKAENVGEVASKVKTAGDAAAEAARKVAEFKAQMEALNGQKSEVLKALNAAEKADQTGDEKTRIQELRTQYEGYAKSIYEVNAAKSAATPEHRAEIEAEGRAILESVNALNEKRRAQKAEEEQRKRDAVSKEKEIRDLTAESNLYKQVSAAIVRVQKAQRDWTAARHGKSSADYGELDEYLKRLQALRVDLETLPANQARQRLAEINKAFQESSQSIRAAGENTKTFMERFAGLAEKFGTWFSVTRVVMTAVRTIRQMVSASRELDDAMTQLQIVTRASNEELEAYSETAAKTARKIGSSISDFVGSTTTYARLGYNTEQSSALAQYTAMLQNVGNIEVADAQDAITSIVKAFNIGVDEIESVMDKLVVTGNNFPISVSQIAEGMTNASSALAAAGNTFDQSVALLTAANTTVQNAAKASTGLRTIAARLRNTKTELDELGEEMTDATYEELVSSLTKYNVSLKDTSGELRSTYDIIADIAKVWDQLDTMEQAGLATAVSGTRQQAIFFSLVEQFREAQGAMEDMANSAGTLEDSYDIYMDSVTAHVNQFKAAFQSLSATAVDSGFINDIVDAGTKLVTVFESVVEVIGKLGTTGTLTLGGIAAAVALIVKNWG